ncbi:hypothetical protein EYW49_08955 [Siculibacillus lacustris]|uniref:Uncharacterized protein n=1 Tax=Siculibacillus lacustris TaxID=1549641 RepID=A0A4Q9VS70_9HYPH|nr:hypothetical protein [Siculibacillus lacustris]TBW38807.1 hypothetical protein EYW49_08955 [Siculibacillus lacustris]
MIGTQRLVPRAGETIARRDLTDPAAIVDRMARDIVAARREGVHGLVDLTGFGWSGAQVMRHATAAHAASRHVGLMCVGAGERTHTIGGRPSPVTGDMTQMVDDLGSAA